MYKNSKISPPKNTEPLPPLKKNTINTHKRNDSLSKENNSLNSNKISSISNQNSIQKPLVYPKKEQQKNPHLNIPINRVEKKEDDIGLLDVTLRTLVYNRNPEEGSFYLDEGFQDILLENYKNEARMSQIIPSDILNHGIEKDEQEEQSEEGSFDLESELQEILFENRKVDTISEQIIPNDSHKIRQRIQEEEEKEIGILIMLSENKSNHSNIQVDYEQEIDKRLKELHKRKQELQRMMIEGTIRNSISNESQIEVRVDEKVEDRILGEAKEKFEEIIDKPLEERITHEENRLAKTAVFQSSRDQESHAQSDVSKEWPIFFKNNLSKREKNLIPQENEVTQSMSRDLKDQNEDSMLIQRPPTQQIQQAPPEEFKAAHPSTLEELDSDYFVENHLLPEPNDQKINVFRKVYNLSLLFRICTLFFKINKSTKFEIPSVLIMGNTGAGKSTLSNHLLGVDFDCVEIEGNWVPIPLEGQALHAAIGHRARSKTLIPGIFPCGRLNCNLFDLMGFCDSRGEEFVISGSVITRSIIQKAKNIKAMIIVIPYEALRDGRGNRVKEALKNLLPYTNNLPLVQDNLIFLISQAPYEVTESDVREMMKNTYECLEKMDLECLDETEKKNHFTFLGLVKMMIETPSLVCYNIYEPQAREDLIDMIREKTSIDSNEILGDFDHNFKIFQQVIDLQLMPALFNLDKNRRLSKTLAEIKENYKIESEEQKKLLELYKEFHNSKESLLISKIKRLSLLSQRAQALGQTMSAKKKELSELKKKDMDLGNSESTKPYVITEHKPFILPPSTFGAKYKTEIELSTKGEIIRSVETFCENGSFENEKKSAETYSVTFVRNKNHRASARVILYGFESDKESYKHVRSLNLKEIESVEESIKRLKVEVEDVDAQIKRISTEEVKEVDWTNDLAKSKLKITNLESEINRLEKEIASTKGNDVQSRGKYLLIRDLISLLGLKSAAIDKFHDLMNEIL